MTLKEQVQEAASKTLSQERLKHVSGVVETASRLAERHGVDRERTAIAGWLHDIAREWPVERLMQTAENIEIPAGFATIPALLHGPIAAHIGRSTFGIEDEGILCAVTYHTTGNVEMSDLDRILYISDAVEPNRNYPGVEHLRELAEIDLNEALFACLDASISYLLHSQAPIFPLTVMARNSLLEGRTK